MPSITTTNKVGSITTTNTDGSYNMYLAQILANELPYQVVTNAASITTTNKIGSITTVNNG